MSFMFAFEKYRRLGGKKSIPHIMDAYTTVDGIGALAWEARSGVSSNGIVPGTSVSSCPQQ